MESQLDEKMLGATEEKTLALLLVLFVSHSEGQSKPVRGCVTACSSILGCSQSACQHADHTPSVCVVTTLVCQKHCSHTLASSSLHYYLQVDPNTLPLPNFPQKYVLRCPALSWTLQILQVCCPSKGSMYNSLLLGVTKQFSLNAILDKSQFPKSILSLFLL